MLEKYQLTNLNQRTLIKITGIDSESFLQSLITIDTTKIKINQLYPAALLSPQGKIAYSFLITRSSEGYIIDINDILAENFAKKLLIYKLHSKINIEIKKIEQIYCLICPNTHHIPTDENILLDKRFTKNNVYRCYKKLTIDTQLLLTYNDWQKFRILSGIPVILQDYQPLELFSHDINLDQLDAIDFNKGCYVGQEVVARMQYKSELKKRLLILHTNNDFSPGNYDILVDNKIIGKTTIYLKNLSLAIIRIDKLSQAYLEQKKITINDKEVKLTLPPYATFNINEPNK
ncbi:folate-binding protein YgfZ [Bartonella sp. DGB1]|uniref:CAF17-like 4Fe-4S cluster assembly/insertion protein YgfZ n=1 Tax=Bartonella sp. DGB1 TaxID=3239807 RepID=UPI0035254A15